MGREVERSRLKYDEGLAKTQFDILGKLSAVHGEIKKAISADYVLADLAQHEKDYIIENLDNIDFYIKLVNNAVKKTFTYRWDNDKMEWDMESGRFKKYAIGEKEKKIIETNMLDLYESFMLKPSMIAILSRNKETNTIMKVMSGLRPEEEVNEPQSDAEEGIVQRIKMRLKKDEDRG